MDSKAAAAMRRISRAGSADGGGATAGFTLLEVICVVAIIGMIAAILLPAIPTGTSQPRLKAYAVQIASLLTADRTAAIRRQATIATDVDALGRSIHSGAGDRAIQLPADVQMAAALAARCNGRTSGSAIIFFASGMSCGGVVTIARAGVGYEIQVNWLTGGIEIVRRRAS
jgi:general secretion pathway protein H